MTDRQTYSGETRTFCVRPFSCGRRSTEERDTSPARLPLQIRHADETIQAGCPAFAPLLLHSFIFCLLTPPAQFFALPVRSSVCARKAYFLLRFFIAQVCERCCHCTSRRNTASGYRTAADRPPEDPAFCACNGETVDKLTIVYQHTVPSVAVDQVSQQPTRLQHTDRDRGAIWSSCLIRIITESQFEKTNGVRTTTTSDRHRVRKKEVCNTGGQRSAFWMGGT